MSRVVSAILWPFMRFPLGLGVHLKRTGNLGDSPGFNPACPQDNPLAGMQLSASSLSYSNLGGAGPDHKLAPGILLMNVFPSRPGIDMLVNVDGPYFPPNPSENRMHNEFLGINLGPGGTTRLKATFLLDEQAIKVPEFVFTVASLDSWITSINVTGAAAYAHTDDAQFTAADGDGSSIVLYPGAPSLPNAAPPGPSFSMSEEAKIRAVAFVFTEVKEFEVTLHAHESGEGKTVWFTGSSNVECEDRALCQQYECPQYYEHRDHPHDIYCAGEPCGEVDLTTCCKASLPEGCAMPEEFVLNRAGVVHSNLGGKGPDFDAPQSILFRDVFPQGRLISLNITAMSNYTPDNTRKNGLRGEFGVVNIETGTSVELLFEFVNRNGMPAPIDHGFWVSLYDFDQQQDLGGRETVTTFGFETYKLSETTTVHVGRDSQGRTYFTAGEFGDYSDNPTHPKSLEDHQFDKTVSIKYPAGVSNFTMILEASDGFAGRNFEFSGYSYTPCPDQATCDTMTEGCPAGFTLSPEAETTFCAGRVCNHTDALVCCWAIGDLRITRRSAPCSTYSCPSGMVLKDEASAIDCADDVCTEFDAQTCCDIDYRPYCSPENTLVLSSAEIRRSYRTGFAREIHYDNVFPYGGGEVFDLVVRIRGDHHAVGTQSATTGSLGRIRIKESARLDLDFHLRSRNSSAHSPVGEMRPVPPFLFSFVGLGTNAWVDGQSYIQMEDGFTDDHPIMARRTHLGYSARNRTIDFTNSSTGSHSRLRHPLSLTRGQKRSTLTTLVDQDRFRMHVVVEDPMSSGFPIIITGGTNLVCPFQASCETMTCPLGYALREGASSRVCRGSICDESDKHTCCTCAEASALTFTTRSVLEANLGAASGNSNPRMLLGNVFAGSAHTVDLEITSASPYYPYNASMNGMNGEFLSLNVRSGTTVDFRFKFIDRLLNRPFKADPFIFSVFDLDQQLDGGAQESVTVQDYLWYRLGGVTTVVREGDEFTGTAHGTMWDNPSNALSLADNHTQRSISFLVDSTTEFGVHLRVSAGWTGRNFLFAGQSVVTCERRALCITHTCPNQFIHRVDANRRVCQSGSCSRGVDDQRCCTRASSRSFFRARWHHHHH